MAEARITHDWDQTASLLALLANIHRPRKSRAFVPSDFHPLKQAHRAPRIEGQSAQAFALMKQTFTPPEVNPSIQGAPHGRHRTAR
jgi:hypothetical protein